MFSGAARAAVTLLHAMRAAAMRAAAMRAAAMPDEDGWRRNSWRAGELSTDRSTDDATHPRAATSGARCSRALLKPCCGAGIIVEYVLMILVNPAIT